MTRTARPRKRKGDMTPENIAAAAERCFQKFGAQRTTMADIADEAGIARQSIYRVFEDRSSLIRFVLSQRVAMLAEQVRGAFDGYETIEQAIVEGSIVSVRVGRLDPIFNQIVTEATDHSIEVFLSRGTEDVHRLMRSLWIPILKRARAEGQIREGASDDQIIEWLRYIHAILTVRDDLKEAKQREMLRLFILPSILAAPR